MDILLSFLEGIITFISPCLLPMLPIYLSYFAGQNQEGNKNTTITNALGFVFGFTIVFVLLGAMAGTIGSFLFHYQKTVNFILGIIMVAFGLNFMNIIPIPFLQAHWKANTNSTPTGFFSSVFFGIVFSVGWTPCVGAFLGSALMMAASKGQTLKGIINLLFYSMGLGIPFIISAILIDRLKSAFDFIKKNYAIVQLISGGFLVLLGILMATGWLGYLTSTLTF